MDPALRALHEARLIVRGAMSDEVRKQLEVALLALLVISMGVAVIAGMRDLFRSAPAPYRAPRRSHVCAECLRRDRIEDDDA